MPADTQFLLGNWCIFGFTAVLGFAFGWVCWFHFAEWLESTLPKMRRRR